MPHAQRAAAPSESSFFEKQKAQTLSVLNSMIRKYDLKLEPEMVNNVVNRAVRMNNDAPEAKQNVKRALLLETARTNPELAGEVRAKISGEGETKVAGAGHNHATEGKTEFMRSSEGHTGVTGKSEEREAGPGHNHVPASTEFQRTNEFAMFDEKRLKKKENKH